MLTAKQVKVLKMAMERLAVNQDVFSCNAIASAARKVALASDDYYKQKRVLSLRYDYARFYDKNSTIWDDLRANHPNDPNYQEQLTRRILMVALFLETKGQL